MTDRADIQPYGKPLMAVFDVAPIAAAIRRIDGLLTRVRSEWTAGEPMTILGVTEQVWTRRVSDGTLTVIVGDEPDGWHLSISFKDHRGRGSRYPRWDEIADARYTHVPDDLTMAITTFHLHELHDQ